jgi:NAD(P)-dependent dehydrogenase (short-subunit alcohol dehydrogenase family)
MAVNLRHQYFCAQAVAPAMRALGSGVILNRFDFLAPGTGQPVDLHDGQGGIEGMTHGLARDLAAMASASIASFPAPCARRARSAWHTPEAEAVILQGQCLQVRVEPDDVAALALFLASDNAAKCRPRILCRCGWYGA